MPKDINQTLHELIRPLPKAKYEVSVGVGSLQRTLEAFDRDYGLELNPDFQRGHVWTQTQQTRYVESLLRGAIATTGLTIQFNHPAWDSIDVQSDDPAMPHRLQCVDGLQRLTAVLAFMNRQIKAFGMTVDDLVGTDFDVGRMNYRIFIAVHAFTTRKELLRYYLDINDGGTPHTQAEIDRVKQLLQDCESKSLENEPSSRNNWSAPAPRF